MLSSILLLSILQGKKFRYLRVIFWCWHLHKPESPEGKYQISFHAFWNLRLLFWYFPSFSSSLHRALVTYCACLFVFDIVTILLQLLQYCYIQYVWYVYIVCFLDISKEEEDGKSYINQGENHYKWWKDLLLWGKVVNIL